jgi:hypothetical protein
MEESSFPSEATETGSKKENFPSERPTMTLEWSRARGQAKHERLKSFIFREVPMNVDSDQFKPLLEHALQVLCAFIRCAKDGDLPPPVLLAEAESAVMFLSSYCCSTQNPEQ